MPLFARIEEARTRWNVLDHPFYRRWEAGELSRAELGRYAGQYRHAVVALAGSAAAAAPLAGDEHAREEAAHVELWDAFAAELGVTVEREASPETEACVRAWSAADPLDALAILYAVESGQPEISRTKLTGLAEHYGIGTDATAAAYFSLHAERDVEHAAESRALLEERATPADEDRLVAVAEEALRGNWLLLDGVTT